MRESSATDCLADKGFSFSALTLTSGSQLHLYNLHADAGQGSLDVETRALSFEQLSDYIERHSTGEAVIVAGDTNLVCSTPRPSSAGHTDCPHAESWCSTRGRTKRPPAAAS